MTTAHTPEALAWWVSCPKVHEFDGLVFHDADSAQIQAELFNDDYPEGENPHKVVPLYPMPDALAGIADPAEFVQSREDLLAACKFVNDTLVKMNMEGRVMDTDTYCAIQQRTFAAISRAEGAQS